MSSTIPVVWCADSSADGGKKPAAFALHGIQLEGNITEKHVTVMKNLVAAAAEGRLILPTDSAMVLLDYGLSVESIVMGGKSKDEENLCCAKCCSRKNPKIVKDSTPDDKRRRKSVLKNDEQEPSSCSSRKTSFDSLCTVSSSDSGFIEVTANQETENEVVQKADRAKREIVQQSHNRRKSLEEFRAILSELDTEPCTSKAVVKSSPNSRKKKEDEEKKLIYTRKLTLYDKLLSYGTIYDITLRKNEINKTYRKYDKYMTYGTIYEILRRHSLESYGSFMRKRRKSKTLTAPKSLTPSTISNTLDTGSCGTIYDILQSLKQDTQPKKVVNRFSVEKVAEKVLEDGQSNRKEDKKKNTRRFSSILSPTATHIRPKIPEIWNIFAQDDNQTQSEELYSRIKRNGEVSGQIYKSNSLDILAGGEEEAGGARKAPESAIKFSVNQQLAKKRWPSVGKSNTRRLSEFTRGEFLNEKL